MPARVRRAAQHGPSSPRRQNHAVAARTRFERVLGEHDFDRQRDANAYLAQVQADLVRGTFIDPQRGEMTLARYVEGWLPAQSIRPPVPVLKIGKTLAKTPPSRPSANPLRIHATRMP